MSTTVPFERKRMLPVRFNVFLNQFLLLSTAFLSWVAPSAAQVQPDGTVGTQVETNVQTQLYSISGGTQADQNLLHSFSNFSVEEGWNARFQLSSNPDVLNVVARVTGSDISRIFGTLSVEDVGHPVSLFLINPNGIIFGSNAQLDLSGSFLASTADSVVFENGYKFSASNPIAPLPVLTIGVPVGLQFGANPAPIVGQFTQRDVDFAVQEGQTLALVGGDVSLQGTGASILDDDPGFSFLTANFGRIDIGSVGAGETVKLSVPNSSRSWALDFSGVQTYKDLTISDALIVFGINTDVFLHGRQVQVINGVQLGGPVSLSLKDVVISITASDLFELDNSQISLGTFRTTFGGNLQIQAKTVRLNSSTINTTTSSAEPNLSSAGNVSIQAEQVDLIDSLISAGGAEASSGGNIVINTGGLKLDQKSSLTVSTSGTGGAGSVNIFSRSILLDRGSAIQATTTSGEGGSINLSAQDALVFRNQSNISTSSTTTGNGGNINILAGLIAAVPSEDSNISTDAVFGNGGKINLTTQGLFGIAPNTANLPNSSDITARSEFGLNGTVDTNIVSTNPVVDLAALPAVLSTKIIETACFSNRRGDRDSFIYSGRGGLPPTPSDPAQGSAVWQDLRLPPLSLGSQKQDSPPSTLSSSSVPSAPSATAPILEAQGWVFEKNGAVRLIAAEIAKPQQTQPCQATNGTPNADRPLMSALGH
jgi:filamentous hemagglutinin family protein